MDNKDWNPDDLLNFDYGKPIPEDRPIKNSTFEIPSSSTQHDPRDVRIDKEEYRRLRSQNTDRNRESESFERSVPQSNHREMPQSYEDYESKKSKKSKKKALKAEKKQNKRKRSKSSSNGGGSNHHANSKFYKFARFLRIPYILALAAFTIILTIMDVLPFFIMVALYTVLGLLSLIILIQLSKNNIKKWAKVLASILAVILIVFYGMGTAYALGTLSFFDKTSVKNDSKVSKITKEPFNVMITGIDTYGKIKTQGRSDVNMLVTVNPNTEQILMTSIPRDYEVRLPDKGYATDKLTHSGFYSVNTTKLAIEDLLDTKINYFVKVNFSTVWIFIDAIGGIDVNSPEEFVPVKKPEWTVKKGMNHMDGHQALAFARERKAFLGGDNERVKNQQLVFEAMLDKATSSKTMLLGYSNILNKTAKYFRMSFSSRELRSLVKMQFARGIKWKIFKNTLTGGGATKTTYSTGGTAVYVTEANAESVQNAQDLIKAVKSGKKLAKHDDGEVYVKQETESEDKDK